MAKIPNSAVGVDLGFHSFKAVALQRKGSDRISVTNFATRIVEDRPSCMEDLSHHLKLLLQDLGSGAKAYAVAISGEESILRIIEQPPTPKEVLRDVLRLNGENLLQRDCSEYVLDCDPIPLDMPADSEEENEEAMGTKQMKYLVGGLPRTMVVQVSEAFTKMRSGAELLEVAPIALLNAFEIARKDVFSGQSFMLIDIGHRKSTVMAGLRGSLKMVRTINYGGSDLLEALTGQGAVEREAALLLLQEGDAGMLDTARDSLLALSKEVLSSIGFFEGQWENAIGNVHLSGGALACGVVAQVMSDTLNIPCELWNPFDNCEVAIPKKRKERFEQQAMNLNVAFGVAAEAIGVAA